MSKKLLYVVARDAVVMSCQNPLKFKDPSLVEIIVRMHVGPNEQAALKGAVKAKEETRLSITRKETDASKRRKQKRAVLEPAIDVKGSSSPGIVGGESLGLFQEVDPPRGRA